MRALLLLLAITLSTSAFAAQATSLRTLYKALSSSHDGTRYRAARTFYVEVKELKDSNPTGVEQGNVQYYDLKRLVSALHEVALADDEDQVRVYAIKGLRKLIHLDILSGSNDESMVLQIWLDILRIGDDPAEPKCVRDAAVGPI